VDQSFSGIFQDVLKCYLMLGSARSFFLRNLCIPSMSSMVIKTVFVIKLIVWSHPRRYILVEMFIWTAATS